MELFRSNKINYASAFVIAGMIFLFGALIFGLTAALQYVIPGFGRNEFSFEKLRPLHVSSAVFWIILAAMGSVLSFLQQHNGKQLRKAALTKWQFYIFIISFISILISYSFGIFGGREYWEFHPLFAIPIVIGWILFIINFLYNLPTLKGQPVYIWMWFTGVVFFLFTYLESNLWLIPGIRNNLVKDMTIQWKSYGSMVGSWNMLIYGSSIFLMDKIAGNKKYSLSKIGFGLYFLGLFNLMFNWGHHIYTLPTEPYVKHIAYLVSMTELFLFGRIIWLWKSSVSSARKNFHNRPFQFLVAADFWVFMTLGLAILMSIPALNIYMHGTHVIVAHTMGATIGINSMLLLAFAYDITGNTCLALDPFRKTINRGYWLMNISLGSFWAALIVAGFMKSYWQFNQPNVPFGSMMITLKPWFYLFYISGILLATGFSMVMYPLLKNQYSCYFKTRYTKSFSGESLKPAI